MDPGYVNGKLAPHVPQFVVVYWQWEKNVHSEAFREEFEQRFDPSSVAGLLDR